MKGHYKQQPERRLAKVREVTASELEECAMQRQQNIGRHAEMNNSKKSLLLAVLQSTRDMLRLRRFQRAVTK